MKSGEFDNEVNCRIIDITIDVKELLVDQLILNDSVAHLWSKIIDNLISSIPV